MSENGTRLVQFGIFEVDLRAGELRRNGSKVKLQEQPFQILSLLLEQPGQVVTREELKRKLWPADTFVDFDHGLNAAIRRLRDALGDSAENPRFVETVARRGYRFLVPIGGDAASVALAMPSSTRPKWWPVLAVLVVSLIGVAGGFFHSSTASSFARDPTPATYSQFPRRSDSWQCNLTGREIPGLCR